MLSTIPHLKDKKRLCLFLNPYYTYINLVQICKNTNNQESEQSKKQTMQSACICE